MNKSITILFVLTSVFVVSNSYGEKNAGFETGATSKLSLSIYEDFFQMDEVINESISLFSTLIKHVKDKESLCKNDCFSVKPFKLNVLYDLYFASNSKQSINSVFIPPCNYFY